MSAGARLVAFVGLLAAVFAAAAFAGSLLDPDAGDADATAHAEAEPAHGGGEAAATVALPGLAVSQDGYTLALDRTALPRNRRGELRFRILGPDGEIVRRFELEHARRMHVILARSDLSGFQHLHPEMAADGSWTTRVRVPDAGGYRVFADFKTGGVKRTLGADVGVDGPVAVRALPAPARVDEADGYRVRLAGGTPRAGRETDLRFEVTRGGRPVAVQPYLAARGHLVALREGDLAYLHVHPDADSLSFAAEFPSAGRYRLFLQFRAGDGIHTVAYTVEVPR